MQKNKDETSLRPIKQERVLITGNAGALGSRLTKRLLKNKGFKVIGVDQRPFKNPPKNLEQYQLDLRRKSAIALLKSIKPKMIVHLGIIRNPHSHASRRMNPYYFNLETTTQLLRLAETINLKKFVFLSTANLYGPSPETSGLLSEDAPLHGANKSPELRDLVTLDMMIQSFFWKQPKTKTVIFRPCHIVGPHLKNAPSRYFMLDTMPTILGYDPMIQLIHENDVIDALILSLKKNIRGIYNIAGTYAAPLSRIIKKLDRPKISLPENILRAFVAGSFASKQSTFPASELDHLKYNCLIDDSRAAAELRFTPKVDLLSIIDEIKKIYDAEKTKQTKS